MRYLTLVTLAHFRHFSHFSSLYTNLRSTTVEKALQIHPFMQNKPNFGNDKMNITLDMTRYYKILFRWRGRKTKPIQTQFKANLTQNKPNLSQFQSQTNPIVERPKMKSFAWYRNLTMIIIMQLADFTTLKGAQFNRLYLTNRQKYDNMESN